MVFLPSPFFIAIKIRDILKFIIMYVCVCVCFFYTFEWVFNIFHFTSIIVSKTEAEKALKNIILITDFISLVEGM